MEIRIVLSVSLCFNLVFAIAYFHSRALMRKAATPEGREQLVADRLDLDQHQRELFATLRGSTRDEAMRLRQSNAAEIEAFWQEMMQENPDRQLIREQIARSSNVLEQLRIAGAENMLVFMRSLRPEQRRAYVEMFRKRFLTEG